MIRSEHGQLYSCIVQAVANLSRAEKLLQLLLRNCPAYDKVDRVGGGETTAPDETEILAARTTLVAIVDRAKRAQAVDFRDPVCTSTTCSVT